LSMTGNRPVQCVPDHIRGTVSLSTIQSTATGAAPANPRCDLPRRFDGTSIMRQLSQASGVVSSTAKTNVSVAVAMVG
jgi:hypothetical protein